MVDNKNEAGLASDADLLRQFVAARDVGCPVCNYNLRDLTTDRCPECGDQLVLRINMAEPRQGWVVAGLVGLSAGAGLHGLLILYAFIRIAKGDSPRGLSQFFRVTGVGFAVLLIALIIWLRCWRGIRRLRKGKQMGWAIACWMLTLASLAYFAIQIK